MSRKENRSMNLNEFAKEVHENAVAHGWWETDRSFAECIVLIHSEWSEALEEARAGRPMLYYICDPSCKVPLMDRGRKCQLNESNCGWYHRKPEGIAVELMDGVIRILDLCSRYGYEFENGTIDLLIEKSGALYSKAISGKDLSHAILFLHYMTSMAGMCVYETESIKLAFPILERCASIAIWWVRQQGLDPEKFLREKHEYNKTRPYKHGKKF